MPREGSRGLPEEAFVVRVNKQAAEDRVNMGQREVVKREDYEEEDDHEKYYRRLQVCVCVCAGVFALLCGSCVCVRWFAFSPTLSLPRWGVHTRAHMDR